jgi:hypothetical protein
MAQHRRAQPATRAGKSVMRVRRHAHEQAERRTAILVAKLGVVGALATAVITGGAQIAVAVITPQAPAPPTLPPGSVVVIFVPNTRPPAPGRNNPECCSRGGSTDPEVHPKPPTSTPTQPQPSPTSRLEESQFDLPGVPGLGGLLGKDGLIKPPEVTEPVHPPTILKPLNPPEIQRLVAKNTSDPTTVAVLHP